jgi:hypothetical protein
LRFQLGILACLLAGCVTQSTESTSPSAPSDRLAAVPGQQGVLRIGLEFLPPDDRFPELEPVLAEPRVATSPKVSARRRAVQTIELGAEQPSRSPSLSQVDIDAIEDPIAREAMQFCSDLIAADRQRVVREVGIPFFDFNYEDPDRGPLLTSERRLREDHERWSQQRGTSLLKRPLRQLAKRLPIAREFEIAVQEFRSDHVPLTKEYRKAHGDRRKLGRLSLRLHVREFEDPVEVVYIHNSGVRLGTSQQRAKMSLNFDLSDTLQVGLRARTDYESGRSGIRTDLIYRPSPHMSVHLAAGDDMDFLSTSSLYSLFESPMDGRAGLVLYAVHTF